jgi:hypothetical protein
MGAGPPVLGSGAAALTLRRVSLDPLQSIFSLPEAKEGEYLLAGLARLVALRGPETLVAGALLLPEPRYFPDPVETRAQGAATLLRRLLAYAGLGALGIDIEIGPRRARHVVVDEHEFQREKQENPSSLNHAAGWFLGIEAGVCYFGLSDSTLRDEEVLIGTLGHEVAHAYRDHHGLIVSSRETEEQLTDLTTVYLGFGFFTLQSSFRFKTGHYDESGQQLLYERQALGYLTPGQLAFLLGAHLALRDQRELPRVLELLASNHAESVRRAHAHFRAARHSLIETLALPPEETWPEPASLSELARPLPPAEVRVADHVEEPESEPTHEERIAFRLRLDRSMVGMAFGVGAGFCSLSVPGVGSWMWAAVFGLGAIGRAIGQRVATFRCSGCGEQVTATAVNCSQCDASLVATIAHLDDRLDAEERYRAGKDPSATPAHEDA